MYISCVETSVCVLVVWRQVYGLWLCGDKCLDIGCVKVSVWILVVLSKCMYFGCVEASV